MKTFIQYIVEKEVLSGAILAGSLAAGQPTPVQDNTTKLPPQPNTVLQTQTELPKEDPYAYFGGEHNVKLYRGLMSAEFRGRDIGDPLAFNKKTFIRTEAIPPKTKNKQGQLVQLTSTAYGPAQITTSTVSGMSSNKRYSDLFKDIDPQYLKSFEAQGQKMKAVGNVKGGQYGLGGCGDLCDEKYTKDYQKTAVAVMRGKMRELGIDDTKPLQPKDARRFVQSWTGPHFSEDYMKAFEAGYNK